MERGINVLIILDKMSENVSINYIVVRLLKNS
jgi:hypothetical protein